MMISNVSSHTDVYDTSSVNIPIILIHRKPIHDRLRYIVSPLTNNYNTTSAYIPVIMIRRQHIYQWLWFKIRTNNFDITSAYTWLIMIQLLITTCSKVLNFEHLNFYIFWFISWPVELKINLLSLKKYCF